MSCNETALSISCTLELRVGLKRCGCPISAGRERRLSCLTRTRYRPFYVARFHQSSEAELTCLACHPRPADLLAQLPPSSARMYHEPAGSGAVSSRLGYGRCARLMHFYAGLPALSVVCRLRTEPFNRNILLALQQLPRLREEGRTLVAACWSWDDTGLSEVESFGHMPNA